MNVLLIFLGGGLGSVLRYIINILIRNFAGNDFPYGILIVNIIGSFAIGLTYGLIKRMDVANDHLATFVMIGLLGGFTTFSAFSLDVVTMINDGKLLPAIIYVLASVVLSILAAFLAIYITK